MGKSWVSILIVAVLIVGVAVVGWRFYRSSGSQVTDFASCAASGRPVMESYPRQCRSADGRTFTENVGNAVEHANLITVSSPQPNTAVASPLTITGQAVGGWYFEASFPVKLFDASNNVLASGVAQAQSDWMTTNFVPFTATLNFAPQPANSTGTLILYKDNPSGLPQNDDQLTIPVSF